MKYIKPMRIDPTSGFDKADSGTCQMKCNREVRMTKEGPVIVCLGCSRIIMDNRK
jgi:hypothetical protein